MNANAFQRDERAAADRDNRLYERGRQDGLLQAQQVAQAARAVRPGFSSMTTDEIVERISAAHDASLDDDHVSARQMLLQLIQDLKQSTQAAASGLEPDQAAQTRRLRNALQFYADGHHFTRHDPHAWDTVSGEPANFYEDDAATATVEDGSVAKAALDGIDLPDEGGSLLQQGQAALDVELSDEDIDALVPDGVLAMWAEAKEDPEERRRFNDLAPQIGDERALVAFHLRTYADLHPGVSFSSICRIMSNVVRKLHTAESLRATVRAAIAEDRRKHRRLDAIRDAAAGEPVVAAQTPAKPIPADFFAGMSDDYRREAWRIVCARPGEASAAPLTVDLTEPQIKAIMDAHDYSRHCTNSYWPVQYARAVIDSLNSALALASKPLQAEVTRLQQALKKANDQAEHFERHWYLVRDELEDVRAQQAAATGAAASAGGVQPGIYVASRASTPQRSAMWRALRDDGWLITASWIDEAGEGQTGSFVELWHRIEREIRSSCGLILYAESADFPLKGAYIEAGLALGAGLPVAVVIPGVDLEPRSDRPIGSWIRHPRVRICATLEDARQYLLSAQPPAA